MAASGSSSFNYKKGSPFFALDDEDGDAVDAAFLKPAASSVDERRQQLLQEKAKIEERTIQSSMRSISLLNESEDIGITTAEELSRQREQLQNTEQKLDEINSALRISQRHIQGIKSVFGGIKNYFSAPPKPLKTVREQKDDDSTKQNGESKLSEVLQNSSSSSNLSSQSAPTKTQTTLPRDRSTDDILDENLGIMGASLSRLKGLGLSLQTEIEDQNSMVERIIGKVDNSDHRIQQQNQQMNKILKK